MVCPLNRLRKNEWPSLNMYLCSSVYTAKCLQNVELVCFFPICFVFIWVPSLFMFLMPNPPGLSELWQPEHTEINKTNNQKIPLLKSVAFEWPENGRLGRHTGKESYLKTGFSVPVSRTAFTVPVSTLSDWEHWPLGKPWSMMGMASASACHVRQLHTFARFELRCSVFV